MRCIWLQTLREVDKERGFLSSPAFLRTLVIPTLKWSVCVCAYVGGGGGVQKTFVQCFHTLFFLRHI